MSVSTCVRFVHVTTYMIWCAKYSCLWTAYMCIAQYMDMIQYTATSVLHVGPVTACIVLHTEYSCYTPCTRIATMHSACVCTHPIQE